MLAKIVFSSLVAFGVLSANVEQFGSFFNEIKKEQEEVAAKEDALKAKKKLLNNTHDFLEDLIFRKQKIKELMDHRAKVLLDLENKYKKEKEALEKETRGKILTAKSKAYGDLEQALKDNPLYKKLLPNPYAYVLNQETFTKEDKERLSYYYPQVKTSSIFKKTTATTKDKAQALLQMGVFSLDEEQNKKASRLALSYKQAIEEYSNNISNLLSRKELDNIDYYLQLERNKFDSKAKDIAQKATNALIFNSERLAFSMAIDKINEKYLRGYEAFSNLLKNVKDDVELNTLTKNFTNQKLSFAQKQKLCLLVLDSFNFDTQSKKSILKKTNEYNIFVDSDPMMSDKTTMQKEHYKIFNFFKTVLSAYRNNVAKNNPFE
ncbi:type IV secretion system apparatus protein CagM [Helicobacter pylori]|uniref:type IV secretion system apparatus protein CagM n=1 Tax=Helicobacter pylori TaxID=210 RepID=UPI003084D708|nr:type IV secretion system apparatus protein CagM [Helicobacter pylori]